MEALKKFDQFIIETIQKYKKVTETDYNNFIELIYEFEEFSNIYRVVLKNEKLQKVEKTFYDVNECLTYLDENEINDLTFIIEFSALENFEDILETVKLGLLDKNMFSKEEQQTIISFLIDGFYDDYEDAEYIDDRILEIDENYEDIIYWINYLKKASGENVVNTFLEESEFRDIVLNEYCNDVIIEYEEEIREIEKVHQKDVSVNTITTLARTKLLNLIEYLEYLGYSEEDYIKLVSYYLRSNLSINSIDTVLFNNIFNNDITFEKNIKKLLNVIVVYDFYISANANKRYQTSEDKDDDYITFIEDNSLGDILKLFKNDEEFSILALRHFVLLNEFEREEDNDIKEEIKEKFNPLSKIDDIAFTYLRRKND